MVVPAVTFAYPSLSIRIQCQMVPGLAGRNSALSLKTKIFLLQQDTALTHTPVLNCQKEVQQENWQKRNPTYFCPEQRVQQSGEMELE